MAKKTRETAMRLKTGSRRDPLASPKMSAARAWHLSMPRIADEVLGLEVRVVGVRTRKEMPEAFIAAAKTSDLLMLLAHADGRRGIACLQAPLLAGVTEIRMLGRVDNRELAERAPTPTDAALVSPLLEAWCEAFDEEVTAMSKPPPWMGVQPGGHLPETRVALLALAPVPLQVAEIALDLGGGARRGMLRLAMPDGQNEQDHSQGKEKVSGESLAPILQALPVTLDAVLARIRLPWRRIIALETGEQIALPGAKIGDISLEDLHQRRVATGRLGGLDGARAVRINADGSGDEQGVGNGGLADVARSQDGENERSDLEPVSEGSVPMPLPDMPEMGGLPDLPSPPGLPDLPLVEGAEAGDGLPELPPLPSSEGLPDLPPVGGLPDLPSEGELPDLPEIGALPPLPDESA